MFTVSQLMKLGVKKAKLLAKVVTDVESATGMTSSWRWGAFSWDSANTRKNQDDNQYMTRVLMTHTAGTTRLTHNSFVQSQSSSVKPPVLSAYTHNSLMGSSFPVLWLFKSHFQVILAVIGCKSVSCAGGPSMAVVALRATSSSP